MIQLCRGSPRYKNVQIFKYPASIFGRQHQLFSYNLLSALWGGTRRSIIGCRWTEWGACNTSRLSGLEKRKIIADRQVWVEFSQSMSDTGETNFWGRQIKSRYLHIIQHIFCYLSNLVVRQAAVFDRRADIRMPKNVGRLVKGHAGLN